jgi:hypothetical protein
VIAPHYSLAIAPARDLVNSLRRFVDYFMRISGIIDFDHSFQVRDVGFW